MAKSSSSSAKGPAIEEIYQKKSQLEHILLRPDTYIGSVEKENKQMWVWDVDEEGKNGKMVNREISYVPGLYKIFDEILVNAADNKQRDVKMNKLEIKINAEENEIVIYNNGKGIPVTMHKEEKMYVPTMIFGHLLTSSNYNDDEKKVVGGRNGYGAKLCNIFSKEFKVETSSKEYKKAFSQTWTDNMSIAKSETITSATGEDFTKITFKPDLSKFKMEKLDKDVVALFSRRAFDVAATSKGVKVLLNGKRLPVCNFKEYALLFFDKDSETGEDVKMAHEIVNPRWEVAIATSEKGFQQVSFVNSIATTRGGKHVDHVVDQVVAHLTELAKKSMKKDKKSFSLKPFQVKNQLCVFVNCLIENPSFDSQTKETMTLQVKNFGSKCTLSEKFMKTLGSIGVVENIVSLANFKAQSELDKKSGKKNGRITGIEKLVDANDAGKKDSIKCTLILTEGDSAKTLVVAGLGVVGRDKYGVFPLRGKLLNVREATQKQIIENTEINHIAKILGLQFKKVYDKPEDLKSLRYGKLMIMTDQDQDGSHIKGLLINFIHHFWPSLLKLNFLEEFITPIVKVTKGKEVKPFYSLPEFEEWKNATPNWNSYKTKYYKGLGTSTSDEAKEYFSDLDRHRITFRYSGSEDDHHVKLAFSKKMIEARKDWLTSSMEERKRRRELGLPDFYLYHKNTKSVTYKDFVNQELILFSNMDNERSIPSLVDGLKPGQRKVMFTCFKRDDKKEVKVAQLAGSVGEMSAYHHGEASLMSTIINLAQNFVGSNNINLLLPNGQFGTRLTGGKDAASPRYIFTMLSPLARKLFPVKDDPLMKYLYDDNSRIEPEYYVPIIPMVLVNGAEGIGTGWSTKIPNHDPRILVENVKRKIRGEQLLPLMPWYKGFRGTIRQVEHNKYVVFGEAALLSRNTFEITELPIQKWTQVYRDSVLEPMLTATGTTPALISDFRQYYNDISVRFVVEMTEENLKKAVAEGLHKVFKLQSSIATSSMVLFDPNGVLKRYDSPEEIFEEFYPIRLKFYVERKRYCEGLFQAEALFLDNQARFIKEKNDGIIVMEKVKEDALIKRLIERNYDSDPVKAWKQVYAPEEAADSSEVAESQTTESSETEGKKSYDFNYLLSLPMRLMLLEHAEKLIKKRNDKHDELAELVNTTPEQLWERDLDEFLAVLEGVEQAESKEKKSDKKKSGKEGKAKITDADMKPAAHGERIEPTVEVAKARKPSKRKKEDKENENKDDVKQPKITQLLTGAAAAGAISAKEDEDDDDDYPVKPIRKPTTQKLKLKQTTLNFKATNRTNNPVASTSAKAVPSKKIIQLDSESEDDKPVAKPKTKKAKKVITKTKKRTSSDFEDDDEDSVIFAAMKTRKKQRNVIVSDDSDEETTSSSQSTTTSSDDELPILPKLKDFSKPKKT